VPNIRLSLPVEFAKLGRRPDTTTFEPENQIDECTITAASATNRNALTR
jgi:hypothetical protein